jgi:glycosyltransferase involved in cell wall biosynthesis
VKQHGLDPSRIQVVANFADDVLFAPREPTPYEGRLRLVFHGTILERYGLRDAMIALSRVRHIDRITLKIIGEGDFSEDLKKLISSLSLKTIVNFDNQMYPLSQLPSILTEYNMGFVPLEISSITEFALPLKLLEYLSLGMPSVTVRNAAIAYYFGEDDFPFFEAGKPQSLASLLDALAEEPEAVIRYQRRAAALRDRFLWSREKEKYKNLLHNPPRRREEKLGPA